MRKLGLQAASWMLALTAVAQNALVEGIVKSKDGHPVEGAVVRVEEFRPAGAKDMEPAEQLVETATGPDGRFSLPSLTSNRVYKLKAYAVGFASVLWEDSSKTPIEMIMSPGERKESKGKYSLRGKVLGPDGKPLAWARVEPDGIGTDGSTGWGYESHFPDHVRTDKEGGFVFARDERFTRLQVTIEVPGLARTRVWLETTNEANVVQMGLGATLTGRVLKQGKPLAGLRVGVSGTDRNSMLYAGNFETRTREDGTFIFSHLVTVTSWQLYGLVASFKEHGSLPPRTVSSGGQGQTNDVGDLEVTTGLRLSGKVQSRTGEPLPKDLRVYVGYDTAWDSQFANVDGSGQFAFDGLFSGKMNVGIQAQGWRLTGDNRSMNVYNSYEMVGLLERDKEDLLLVVEKGERQYYGSGSGNGQLPQADQPDHFPLMGAESSGPTPIILGGCVFDDKTGLPVPVCKIVPGYKPPVTTARAQKPVLQKILEPFAHKAIPWNEVPFWFYGRAETFSNGNFSVKFLRLTSTPMLRVEAAGYGPVETEPMATNVTNLVIRLTKSAGVCGVVLLPEGKPANNATVFYACARERCSLVNGVLDSYGEKEGRQTTGTDGKFNFQTRAQSKMIYVAHSNGWAEQPVETAGEGLTLQLRPWASIVGTLVYSNGAPAIGVNLGLTTMNDWNRGEPIINISGQCVTDAKGHFQFSMVPLRRRIDVGRIIPMGGGGWSYGPQTWLEPKPGTNDLGTVTYDKPPAPPLLDELKRKMGL